MTLPASGTPVRRDQSLDFPDIRLEILEDLSPPGAGFMRLVRRRYRAHYPDGTVSEPFVYDEVERVALDAVIMVAHYLDESGTRRVFLRSAVRPPLAERASERALPPAIPHGGLLWELPAGLIEPSEEAAGDPRLAARREIREELGFEIALEELSPLGATVFPVPAFIAERHFFFEVEVDPETQRAPSLDGSALEHFGVVVALPLQEALERCRRGEIMDSKTELGLRRLAERFGAGSP